MFRRLIRAVSQFLTWFAILMSVESSPAFGQATSLPGAVGLNGDFYILREEGLHLQVWQWDFVNGWQKPAGGTLAAPSAFGIGLDSRPAGRTSSGGFHAVIRHRLDPHGTTSPRLIRWEPGLSVTSWLTKPETGTVALSPPSECVSDRYVYSVSGNDSTSNHHLYEADTVQNLWTVNHGSNTFAQRPRVDAPACVLNASQYFVASENGHLEERWSNGSGFSWGDHGKPARGVDVVAVGAAMPSNKVFATCDNGSLWQRWWDAAAQVWRWHNHGIPYGWRVDSPAVSLLDGKLFVTGDWDHSGGNTRVLLQLFYSGGVWQWHNHGTPPGTSIAEGGAAVAFGGRHVVVKGTDGLFYMCYFDWASNSWLWKNCGTPP